MTANSIYSNIYVMRKTMVYLPEETYLALRLAAKNRGSSMAKIVRDFVSEGIKKTDFNSGASVLKKLEKYKVKGGKTLSKKIDTIY